MTIGEIIKKLRIEAGYTQDELAKLIGYKSRATINKVETGEREATQSMVAKFAKVFNTTPSVIMGWETPSNNAENLSADEQKLIDNYRSLNEEGQQTVCNLVDGLIISGKYKKSAPNGLGQKEA